MLDDDLSTTTPSIDTVTVSQRKAKKLKAKVVLDRKLNYLTLKPLQQAPKTKKPRNFKLFKESSLPWNDSITTMFKEYERKQHKGADQDVDTDDDNIEYGKSALLDDLRLQVTKYQTDEQYAVQQIRNTTLFKEFQGGLQFM